MKTSRILLFATGLLILQGCDSNKGSSPAPAPSSEIIVQPSVVRDCDFRRGSYRCMMDMQNAEGSGTFPVDISLNNDRRGRRITRSVTVMERTYRANGEVHKARDRQDVPFTYSVSCSQGNLELNVKSSNNVKAMRLNLTALDSYRPHATLLLLDTNERVSGTGSCSLR